MRWLLLAVSIAIVLVVLDRVALAMERRGWIYYRKKKASPGTGAAAALELHSILEPDRRRTVVMLEEQARRFESDDSGDPPDREPRS